MFAILTTLLGVRAGSAPARQVVFWGMNAGLAVFVVGLIGGTVILKEIGAPTMGVCLLLGLARVRPRVVVHRAGTRHPRRCSPSSSEPLRVRGSAYSRSRTAAANARWRATAAR